MLYKPVEYMKKYIVCVTVIMLIMLCGCNKQKATDIVIDNSRYSQTTKADNPYKDQAIRKHNRKFTYKYGSKCS